MKVSELKSILENALYELEQFNDDEVVVLEPNTYGIGDKFLGISGYNGGYVDLENINTEEKE